MASPGFKLYRSFGEFWANQREGALARFAKSDAFGPVMFSIMIIGFVLILGLLGLIPSLEPLMEFIMDITVFTVALGWSFLMLLLIMSRGAIEIQSFRHPKSPEQVLVQSKEMLAQHGFRFEEASASSFRAVRAGMPGPSGAAEKEWRALPLEALVTVSPDGEGATISVRCAILAGVFRRFGELNKNTCKAISELDARALELLDKTIPFRQGGLMLGGLASSIFNALSICAVASVLTLSGLMMYAGPRLLEYSTGLSYFDQAFGRWLHVLDAIDLPPRAELTRFMTAAKTRDGSSRSAEEILKEFRLSTGDDNLVIGVKQTSGAVSIILPREGSAMRPLAQALFTTGISGQHGRIQKVGDRIFQRLDYRYARDLESQLGLKSGQLIGGWLFTYDDLKSRTPFGLFWSNTELTVFQMGRSILRYQWGEKGITVDQGSRTVPIDVLKAGMDAIPEFSFLSVLIRPAWADTFRREEQDGKPYWVVYVGQARESGWSGFSLAIPAGHVQSIMDEFLLAAIVIGSFALALILLFVFAYSTVVSARIARPVLQVRDALRSIAEGDYSVRVETKRTDEIGQLQKLVNHTAEELKKRESIKELLGKYLSKQVADRIMEGDSDEALAGRRKEVSILFADVRGFTAYSEKHDPEQVTKSLNEYFEVMVDVIAGHEGVLDKYIGDGLMVVFGAPMAQEDHARRAVITALEMQAALQSLNLKRAQRGDDPINIGIGVNTGLAISGNLGSIKRMEFTVIGDSVNTAARLERNAKQGQILIGRITYEKVKDLIECEPLGQITVKGKAEPVDIWWLKGLKPRKA